MRSAVAPGALREAPRAEPADDTLVARVREGDDRAFEHLFERHHRAIGGYVRGLLRDHGRAEDVTQEVFFSALRRMRQTDRPIAFRPWIHEIARNACIDEFRRARRKPEVSIDTVGEGLGAAGQGRLADQGLSPDAAVDQRQAMRDLWGAFDGLSDTHHRVLVMRELSGLSYREIGEELGMTGSAVESAVFRARRRLSAEYRDLASGRSCARAQTLMEPAAGDRLGQRDQRDLARHLAHCPYCRMKARVAGVDIARLPRPARHRSLAERIGALLPLPAILRDRFPGGAEAAASGGGHGPGLVAHLPSFAPVSEPLATGWGKAAAAVVALAVAGAGAGVSTHMASKEPEADRATRSPDAVARASGRAPGLVPSLAPSAGMPGALAAASGPASSSGPGVARNPARASLFASAGGFRALVGDTTASPFAPAPRATETPAAQPPGVPGSPTATAPAPGGPGSPLTPGASAPKDSSGRGPRIDVRVPKLPGSAGSEDKGSGRGGKGEKGSDRGGKEEKGSEGRGKREDRGRDKGGEGSREGEREGRTPEGKPPEVRIPEVDPPKAPEIRLPGIEGPKAPRGEDPKGGKGSGEGKGGKGSGEGKGGEDDPAPAQTPSGTVPAPAATPDATLTPVPTVSPLPAETPSLPSLPDLPVVDP